MQRSIQKNFSLCTIFHRKKMGYPHHSFHPPSKFNLQNNTGCHEIRSAHLGKIFIPSPNFKNFCTVNSNELSYEFSIEAYNGLIVFGEVVNSSRSLFAVSKSVNQI